MQLSVLSDLVSSRGEFVTQTREKKHFFWNSLTSRILGVGSWNFYRIQISFWNARIRVVFMIRWFLVPPVVIVLKISKIVLHKLWYYFWTKIFSGFPNHLWNFVSKFVGSKKLPGFVRFRTRSDSCKNFSSQLQKFVKLENFKNLVFFSLLSDKSLI